jgi:hypothetical protein
MDLTSPDRRSENVGILAIVVAELKFSDVERHVLGTHFVEGSHGLRFFIFRSPVVQQIATLPNLQAPSPCLKCGGPPGNYDRLCDELGGPADIGFSHTPR